MASKVDRWGIALTPEVVMARDAADKFEIIVNDNRNNKFDFFVVTYNNIQIALPAGMAQHMLDALHYVGGGNGLLLTPVAPMPTKETMDYLKKREAGVVNY
jgi:hypothetical protein